MRLMNFQRRGFRAMRRHFCNTYACCTRWSLANFDHTLFQSFSFGPPRFEQWRSPLPPAFLCLLMLSGVFVVMPARAAEPGAAVTASPAKVYGYRDGRGKMVFTDKAAEGSAEIPLSPSVVVEGSKLGLKAYSRQQPVSLEQIEAGESSARRAADKQRERDWLQEDRQRQRCERLREIVSNRQHGTPAYRSGKQRQYDTECIAFGF